MRNVFAATLVAGFVLASSSSEANAAGDTPGTGNEQLSEICPEDPIAQSFSGTGSGTELYSPGCGPGDPGDPGSGGNGGTPPPPPPPFSPPPMAYPPPSQQVPTPPFNSNYHSTCNQFPHPILAFSNDVVRGATLYLSGIVAPGTNAVYGFYTPSGQLADLQLTNAAKSNCVIHHDENPFNTSGLAPGYYSVYISYVSLGAPYTVQCFYGSPPPNFNYNIVTPGFHCSQHMQYVTTIRIR